MLQTTIINAFKEIMPLLIITTVIFSLIRLFSLIYTNQKIVIYQELLSLCFLVYVLGLFYIVTFQDYSYGTSNYVPFKEIFRFPLFSDAFNKNIIGNIVLFMPLGYFGAYYIKGNHFGIVTLISLISSLTIEITQKYNGRTFDIDDIILNVVGGICGYIIYRMLSAMHNAMPKFFKTDLFLNIFAIIIIIICILYFNIFGAII